MKARRRESIAMQQARRSHNGVRRRRGVAAVEFAVCIPLFALLTIGAIQATDGIYLKNSLRVAAYESARVAIQSNADTLDAKARADEVLAARNVKNAIVEFRPSDVTSAAPGEPIRVTVRAPANDNTIMPNWFLRDRVIRTEFIMLRE